MPITTKVQNQAGDKMVQPSSNRSVNVAGTRLRRRLSKIFHWDSVESGFCSRPVSESARLPGTRYSDHDAICQAPRIQRCRRLTTALERDGYSSYNCTSLNSPA